MTPPTMALLITLALGSLLPALVAQAQSQAKVPSIGWLASGFPPSEANRQRSPSFKVYANLAG